MTYMTTERKQKAVFLVKGVRREIVHLELFHLYKMLENVN